MAMKAAFLLAAAGWDCQALGSGQEACDTEGCASDAAGLLQVRSESATTHVDAVELTTPLVHAVYTYGAPATKGEPFRNAATRDGCFPGLRSYTEDILGAFDEIHQVDAAAMHNFYPHSRTASVILHLGKDSIYTPCNTEVDGHPDMPKRGPSIFHEWRLHQEDDYVGRLKAMTIDGAPASEKEPFKTARLFADLAWRSYDTFEDAKAWISGKMPDWSLVTHAMYTWGLDEDPLLVVQQASTLDCAIVFAGTNDFSEFSASTTQHETSFCGFEGVHIGYANEVRNLMSHLGKFISPILAKCREVTCVGHSLGGSLCEVFAACANSGNATDPDYKALAWNKETPVLQAVAEKSMLSED